MIWNASNIPLAPKRRACPDQSRWFTGLSEVVRYFRYFTGTRPQDSSVDRVQPRASAPESWVSRRRNGARRSDSPGSAIAEAVHYFFAVLAGRHSFSVIPVASTGSSAYPTRTVPTNRSHEVFRIFEYACFSDVPANPLFFRLEQKMKEIGITAGDDDKKSRPPCPSIVSRI